jgi:hypothetical protein
MTRTKLLSSDQTKLENLFASDQFSEVLSPRFEQEAGADTATIDRLLDDLSCLSNRSATNAKMRVLLSSLILQAQRLRSRIELNGGEMVIGWPHDEAFWRVRSKVGYKVAITLRKALIEHGWLTHKVGATINLHDGTGNCHGYLIADFVPSMGDDITFQSSDMVYATKSKALKTKVENKEIDQRTKALWALWKKSPLTYNNQKMWMATRTFSNKELTRGGRFYGPWTNMKQAERLKCTIDGQPVAEVDVSGMYLTLLCSITDRVPFTADFQDPYQLPHKFNDIDRSEVKAVINSAIGGGTCKQTKPTKLMTKAGIVQERLTKIRKVLIPAYECLKSLKKGEMYSETLAIHETEIMLRLVERLQKPVFILHDCLICQQEDALNIGDQLQQEYVSYCLEQGWTAIKPAFSIEYDSKEKILISGGINPC